jgi:hypothetical protein
MFLAIELFDYFDALNCFLCNSASILKKCLLTLGSYCIIIYFNPH